MRLNEFVESVFVISLERRPEKLRRTKKVLEEAGIEFRTIFAVDGENMRIEYPCHNKGANGCTLSHYIAVRTAKSLGLSRIFVFEDDIELRENFEKYFDKISPQIPVDWDMIYLSGSNKEEPERISDHILKVNRTLTTHAYGLKDTLFDYVINNFPVCNNTADGYYAEIQKTHKVYMLTPSLGWQRDGISDVENRYMSYPWLQS